MGTEDEGNPEWVNVLAEECKELRESNLQLRQEVGIDILLMKYSQNGYVFLTLFPPHPPSPPLPRRIICAMKQQKWNARREN